jgi:hypothetical protein
MPLRRLEKQLFNNCEAAKGQLDEGNVPGNLSQRPTSIVYEED